MNLVSGLRNPKEIAQREAVFLTPGGARGQLRALDQHDVGPAELGEMVEHAAADHAAPDHRHPNMRLHGTRRPSPTIQTATEFDHAVRSERESIRQLAGCWLGLNFY